MENNQLEILGRVDALTCLLPSSLLSGLSVPKKPHRELMIPFLGSFTTPVLFTGGPRTLSTSTSPIELKNDN